MVMTSISCSKWSSTKMKQFSLTIWWWWRWSRSVGLPYIGPGTITWGQYFCRFDGDTWGIIDFLFQVNGITLKGLYHEEVVNVLKEVSPDMIGPLKNSFQLGSNVVLVCSRRMCGPSPLHGTIVNNVETARSKQAFNTRVSSIDIITRQSNILLFY